MVLPLADSELHALYVWVDGIPLSRPKRNIARDFSDGVCVAEIVKHFFPRLVDVHNYVASLSSAQKRANWETLNHRVFRKVFGFQVTKEEINDITSAVPGAIEQFLRTLQLKISQLRADRTSDFAVEGSHVASSPTDDKDAIISELSQTVRLLTRKVKQLEELVRLRDDKIASLQR